MFLVYAGMEIGPGKPIMKKLAQLPQEPLWIHQPDKLTVPTPLRDVGDAEKKLVVWTCPSGDSGLHVKEIV